MQEAVRRFETEMTAAHQANPFGAPQQQTNPFGAPQQQYQQQQNPFA